MLAALLLIRVPANVRVVREERPPSNCRWSPRAARPSIRLVGTVQLDGRSRGLDSRRAALAEEVTLEIKM